MKAAEASVATMKERLSVSERELEAATEASVTAKQDADKVGDTGTGSSRSSCNFVFTGRSG